MHSQKTRALLKSVNLLKKENQKILHQNKTTSQHRTNETLKSDLKMMDICVDALRELLDKNSIDKDAQDIAIKRKLEGPVAKIRVLSREELKIEIQKYKNISLKIIKEFNKTNKKVPSYAKSVEKESGLGVGLKEEKDIEVDASEQESSMFEHGDDLPDDLPQPAKDEIERHKEEVVKMKNEVKNKNEKLIDLLTEMEEVKVLVHARDKQIELQRQQITDLLEELRESKQLENDVKHLIQESQELKMSNQKLRAELAQNQIEGEEGGAGDSKAEVEELTMINTTLNGEIKALQAKLQQAQKDKQTEVGQLRKQLESNEHSLEETKRQYNQEGKAVEQKKDLELEMANKETRLHDVEKELAEAKAARQEAQKLIADEKQKREAAETEKKDLERDKARLSRQEAVAADAQKQLADTQRRAAALERSNDEFKRLMEKFKSGAHSNIGK